MFVFDNSEDLDIATYEYRLYESDQVEPDPANPGYYRLIGGTSIDSGTITPYSQGFNLSNVFTVAVENSTTTSTASVTSPVSYYGAVRAIDTSTNVSVWTLIGKTGTDTPLIDEEFIGSLTAAKITAGTIGAAEIILNGANSIIRSSGYNPGVAGWKITGFGDAEFNDLTVRTSLDIGGSDSSSFHVDINGNLWLGAGLYSSAPFRISNTGNVDVGGTDSSSFHIDNTGNIWAGAGTFNTSTNPFSVTAAGALRATGANISGTVTATLGTIGGWSIGSNFIRSSGSEVTLSSNGQLTIGSNVNDQAIITNNGDFFVTGFDSGGYGAGNSRFYGPWFNVKKGYSSGASQPNAQLTYKDLTFFTSTTNTAGIAGGNDGGNANIYVTGTGSYISSGGHISAGTYSNAGTSMTAGTYISAGTYINSNVFYSTPGLLTYEGTSFGRPGIRIDKYYFNYFNAPGWGGTYGYFAEFVNADSTTNTGSISISGGGVAFNSSSDKRLKENIKLLTNGVDIIKKINPVEYNFKGFDRTQHGLIAQDLYAVYAHGVNIGDDNEEEVIRPWAIDYGKLTPLLITAVKELVNRVEELESRLV
jgi:hypothetical protein